MSGKLQGIWNDVPRRPRGARAHRPGPWMRLSIDAVDHPKVMGLSDAAFRAWIIALTRSKRQPEPGLFVSEKHLRAVIRAARDDEHYNEGRLIRRLIEASLLDRRGDGAILVHDWSDWQTPKRWDETNAERQARHRKKRAADATLTDERRKVDGSELTHLTDERRKVERESADVTAVTQPLRVTRSNGGPPLGDNAVTTAFLAGGVTAGRARGFDRRRDLAAIIRNAPTDALRHRYRRMFEKTYGHLYERSVA